jgi:hypothetical protein
MLSRRLRRRGWAQLEGDSVVLAALLTGVAVGLAAGVLWHSAHAGGAGWTPVAPTLAVAA